MKEALLYEKLKDKWVRCGLCNHQCLIDKTRRGICGVRENGHGKLYTLVYGKAIAENIDPIEKKPFYHFLPGTFSLSIATVGCNFQCLHCQNADISQVSKERADVEILGKDLPPEKVVKHALDNNCPSISYTYTEPTIFLEYALDCMKLARSKGLKNNWVSNGYMTKEALDLIAPYLDAINVDLKAFTEKFYQEVCKAKLAPVLENLKKIKKKKIWLEVTTLIIPKKNDSEKELKQIAEFIKNELGEDTPWHVSRFFPYYKLDSIPPTSVEKVRQAVEIGKKAGLKYVYAGNV
jgi:pyruvate formate lyase activating enzyme